MRSCEHLTIAKERQKKCAKAVGRDRSAIVGKPVRLAADLGEKIIEVFENPKDSFASFSKLVKAIIANQVSGAAKFTVPELGKAIR
jgi:hypothetical protein